MYHVDICFYHENYEDWFEIFKCPDLVSAFVCIDRLTDVLDPNLFDIQIRYIRLKGVENDEEV